MQRLNLIDYLKSMSLSYHQRRDIDPDVTAFALAADIPDPAIIQALNNFVYTLKQAGIWGKLIALYPMAGNTLNNHKYNLKDPRDLDAAFRLVYYNNPVHNVYGIQFNGVDQYADTLINNTVLSKTSWSWGTYCMTDNTNNFNASQTCGTGTVTGVNTGVYLGFANRLYMYMNTFTEVQKTITSTLGLFSGSRLNDTVYVDTRHGNISGASVAENHNASSIKIGKWNNYSSKTCGGMFIASYLTLAELAILRIAFDNFKAATGVKPF